MGCKSRRKAKRREKQTAENILEKSGLLPEKQFSMRNSLLTDMFDKIPHIRSIHHIFVAILICLGLSTVAHDHLIKKRSHFGLILIYSGFGKFYWVVFCWVVQMLVTVSSFVYLTLWATGRSTITPNSKISKAWDCFGIVFCLVYHGFCFILAAFLVNKIDLPPPSACIVILEQIRLSMKVHAFVRTTAGCVIEHRPYYDQDAAIPGLLQFVYFLFAPTCVYRNEYPKSGEVRLKFIIFRALEIVGVIVCLSFIFHKIFIPAYHDFGIRRFTWNELIVSFLEHALPALLVYVCGFYLLLHSLQNIFAEILLFGDRQFYKDWWNCRSFSDFFRNWNTVVHDWLYTYIYKDTYEHVVRNKTVAKITTLVVSAVVHEWALMNVFGYFFPGVFIFFMIFVFMIYFVKIPDESTVNILFWVGLALGCGFLVSGYTLEYFARNNLPEGDGSMKDILLPRWLTCDCID